MAIDRIEVTLEDIKATNTFQQADKMLQEIYSFPYYVKAVSGWLTVAKYKGLDFMLNVYHMNDFKRALVKELFEQTP